MCRIVCKKDGSKEGTITVVVVIVRIVVVVIVVVLVMLVRNGGDPDTGVVRITFFTVTLIERFSPGLDVSIRHNARELYRYHLPPRLRSWYRSKGKKKLGGWERGGINYYIVEANVLILTRNTEYFSSIFFGVSYAEYPRKNITPRTAFIFISRFPFALSCAKRALISID